MKITLAKSPLNSWWKCSRRLLHALSCNRVFEECDLDDANERLNSDKLGYQIYNYKEIFNIINEAYAVDSDDSSSLLKRDRTIYHLFHAIAFSTFKNLMNWYEKQPECYSSQLFIIKRTTRFCSQKTHIIIDTKEDWRCFKYNLFIGQYLHNVIKNI